MKCYVTSEETVQEKGSTILFEDQFFDSEADFCRVYTEDAMTHLEQVFLWNRISYCIEEENASILSRLFGLGKHSWVFRINQNDMEYALWLVGDMRGVEVIAKMPEHDWTPKEAKKRRVENNTWGRRRCSGREMVQG